MIPKFRAWDKRENTMRDVAVLHFTKGGKVNSIEYWKTPSELKSYHVRNLVLMQSTGLKDLNGVEIFEGDIVSVRNHPFQKTESSVGIEIDGDYKVSWNEYDLTWCAGNLLLARIKPYVTVIGNIHENP
ncbi:DNA-packaging protein [Enterococcus faecalis]|uniref:YopX family protein n=2 Tax=Enterococcus TaxID=1350 RepID=UPI0015614B69|nr:YopX family protein [Enterococcus faecalis]NRD99671.1 DNA-packaging protein [Enterococcus faecalis]NRE01624.1 DNA-packaging protein [Enterococcus faecalis]NRE07353.1 DNA-packaging protein [Enterococcus faecalis]NRE10389.1 DNA-packaging protein [Enterococcus faecalis]NRE13330.1 DNA-packaging protein [Enterococcus faecalis]